MSDKGTVSPKEKEATEKRGRGRPRKQAEEKASDVSGAKFKIFFFFWRGVHVLDKPADISKQKCVPEHQQQP